jgi:DNA helicase II / ATP-dependent DNA helicase PcrA
MPIVSAMHGHLRVITDRGGARSYALGPRTALDDDPPMLDWRTAPLAEAFFRYAPGEAFELEVADDKIVTGRVLERSVPGVAVEALPAPVPRVGAPPAALPVLDREQQAAVDLPPDTSLVLDGEAGVGKTLVALFRVAALRRANPRLRALVLVPTEGLRRLVGLIAERLGLERVEIAMTEDWLVERGRAAFGGLPKRTSSGAAAQVIALKRHPAVRAVLDDFVGWTPPRGVDDDRIPRTRQRLLHLWGDRERLARIVEAAGGALPARAIEATALHTRAQFENTTERALRHVDAERLVALDGRALDAGTPMEDAHTFDAEDVPVLFELVRRGALPAAPKLARYDHIVIDEAQLRAPLELAAIADALVPGGSVTLAGDQRQATDESAWFAGWAAARAELPATTWAAVTLAVTYRSVPAIAELARAVLAGPPPRLPGEPPADPAAWASRYPSALAQAAAVCWTLAALTAREPWRQICVLGRTAEHARRLHAELARGLDPVLVLDGDFRFEPGVVVAPIAAISGLEFDAVVIPDFNPTYYPSEVARGVYVAMTRARDWLWLTAAGAWSPLTRDAADEIE